MNNDTVREIDRMFVIRRTRILGIAILVGVFLVYIFGVFLPTDNTNPEYSYLNHISFIFCAALCTGSLSPVRPRTRQLGYGQSEGYSSIISPTNTLSRIASSNKWSAFASSSA